MTTANMTTDDLIIHTLVKNNGEMLSRDLLRVLGSRLDYGQALMRLVRTKRVEMISKTMRGRRPQRLIRLIGEDDILLHGVGFARLKR